MPKHGALCRHIACEILGIDDRPKSKQEAMKRLDQLQAAAQAMSEHADALMKWESKRRKK
jgi:hypothetical protein